jgi:aminomethyltransferase
MNIRRIEGGILNYRTDMDWHTTPYDMGLGQFVDLDSHNFIGRDALRNASREPRFSGFKCEGRPLRYGTAVMSAGQSVGRVTAYEISPYLKCGVGFVLFDSPQVMNGSGFTVAERDGSVCPVELVELPFYDAEKNIPRGLESAHSFID